MPLPTPPHTTREPEKSSSARSAPLVIELSADPSPLAARQISEDGVTARPKDPFGDALSCIGTLVTVVIARLKSYESELCQLKANAEAAFDESAKLVLRLIEVTSALNDKATIVAATQQKLDDVLAALIDAQTETPNALASAEGPATTLHPDAPQDQAMDAARMQAQFVSQTRHIELLEEQLKADRIAAQRKIEALDAELQRERLQHALAGDRSFGRAA